MGLRIKRADLLGSLLEALGAQGGGIQWDKKLVSITDGVGAGAGAGEEEGGIEVVFADGATARADMIVGCDGIHSPTRTSYVDPDRKPEYTGQCVAFGFVGLAREGGGNNSAGAESGTAIWSMRYNEELGVRENDVERSARRLSLSRVHAESPREGKVDERKGCSARRCSACYAPAR